MKNNVSFDSRLSKFGIGLFETIRVEENPIDLDLHMDRMFKSIEDLNLNISESKEFLTKEILGYIEKNKVVNKALRLTVFDEGYNISTREISYNEETYKNGFKLIVSPIKRGNSIIYNHKTTNYYENIYTKEYATRNNFDDGLFVSCDDIVLECSMSNIFFVKGEKVYTPHSDLSLLNGIMKDKIFSVCEDLKIDVVQGEIKLKDIEEYDFVFVTNSLMKAVKVVQINEVIYSNQNEIFDKIMSAI